MGNKYKKKPVDSKPKAITHGGARPGAGPKFSVSREQPRNAVITTQVTQKEKEQIKKYAKSKNISVSDMVRDMLKERGIM